MGKGKPLTLGQLALEIGRHIALHPEDADKRVLSTTECGHVHEYISGIERVERGEVFLGEADWDDEG